MGRRGGVVSNTSPENQPRKHAALAILAELGIKNAPDGKPYGMNTERICQAMRAAGYVWRQKDQEWCKSDSPRMLTLEQRFWSRVDKRSENECWEWVNGSYYKHPYTGEDTYGCIFFEGRRQGAHRCSWFLHFGHIPDGLFVLHSCDNPKCVNPAHLFLGTHQDNMDDKVQKGRANGGANKGEINPEHILKTEQVKEVLRLHNAMVPRKIIAEQMGVHYTTITAIVTGRTWRHIPRD